jgi:uncharacterized protein YdaU (DUF1376 family)
MARTQVDHYIPFFGRDFYASTAMWTAEEVGHYIRLLVIQWDSGGLPSELERLELVSPGVSRVWPLLSGKFPACDDGLRRNPRMEEHRAKAFELKELRSQAGREGGSKSQANRKQTGKQKPSKPQANGEANGQAKVKPPSPSPSPSPTPPPKDECRAHTQGQESEYRNAGWAADEWQAFVSAWNATERAVPWTPLVPPSSWVDYAASPGWLSRAREAMGRLPCCLWFSRPLAVTRFFEYVDRILAGEFDQEKQESRSPRHPVGGNL